MNRGTVSGLTPDIGWTTYTPDEAILVGFYSGGTVIQPVLGSSTVAAHYLYDRQIGNVLYQGNIIFSSDATFGGGGETWGIRLPVPAFRVLGGADMPVGLGLASTGTRNVPLRATLMDPQPTAKQSDEDYYIQFFVPYNLASGTGSIAAAGTSTTITHSSGMTPQEFDIEIVPTSNTTNNINYFYITNCTSTQFTVNIQTAATAQFNFSWKIRGEPNAQTTLDLLLCSLRPFGGGWASGYSLGWSVEYQARR